MLPGKGCKKDKRLKILTVPRCFLAIFPFAALKRGRYLPFFNAANNKQQYYFYIYRAICSLTEMMIYN